MGINSNRAAPSLLSWLEQKRQERLEAVTSINFLHPTCKPWSTINKRTIRSGRSSRLGPRLSKLHRLTTCEERGTQDQEPNRPIHKQLSDLWKVLKPEGISISGPFRAEEFAAALRCLKPEKIPELDSFFPEFIALDRLASFGFAFSSLPAFANSNPQDLEKTTKSYDP